MEFVALRGHCGVRFQGMEEPVAWPYCASPVLSVWWEEGISSLLSLTIYAWQYCASATLLSLLHYCKHTTEGMSIM